MPDDTDQQEKQPNWEGRPDNTHNEHRTVGPHRARCWSCDDWCYPNSLCTCCENMRLHEEGADADDELVMQRQLNERLKSENQQLKTQVIQWRMSIIDALNRAEPHVRQRIVAEMKRHNSTFDWSWLPHD